MAINRAIVSLKCAILNIIANNGTCRPNNSCTRRWYWRWLLQLLQLLLSWCILSMGRLLRRQGCTWSWWYTGHLNRVFTKWSMAWWVIGINASDIWCICAWIAKSNSRMRSRSIDGWIGWVTWRMNCKMVKRNINMLTSNLAAGWKGRCWRYDVNSWIFARLICKYSSCGWEKR